MFPNTQISFYPERTLITRSRPHPSGDPGRMIFDLQSFEQVPAGADVPARPPTVRGAGPDVALEPDFVRQDAANVVRIQQGLRSSGYDGAQLGDAGAAHPALARGVRARHGLGRRARREDTMQQIGGGPP